MCTFVEGQVRDINRTTAITLIRFMGLWVLVPCQWHAVSTSCEVPHLVNLIGAAQ